MTDALRALRYSLLAAVLRLLAPVARAQHPGIAAERSLAARLALADAVAIATVTGETPGRLAFGEVRALEGALPDRFEVKRAPSAAPPLGVGDRAVLLLRGARPPYVLVDEPDETIRLADAAAEARWAEAIGGWLAVRGEPGRWLALYEGWIDTGPDTLRQLAVNGIVDRKAPIGPLPEAAGRRFGDLAWDTARPPAARRAYALLASLSEVGAARLAEGLQGAPPDCDAGVAVAAVQSAGRRPALASAVLARGLDHSDAEVRRASLLAAQGLRERADAELRERVARVAREDAESWLRADAERTLATFAP
jgi:hypothetical protein